MNSIAYLIVAFILVAAVLPAIVIILENAEIKKLAAKIEELKALMPTVTSDYVINLLEAIDKRQIEAAEVNLETRTMIDELGCEVDTLNQKLKDAKVILHVKGVKGAQKEEK